MTKNTYTVAVFLYGASGEQGAMATLTGQEAETAIRAFEAGRTLSFAFEDDGVTGTGYIPYHAIGHLLITTASEEVTVTDAFCEEASSDEGGSDEGGSDEGGGEDPKSDGGK